MNTLEEYGSLYSGRSPEEIADELKKLPFFMTEGVEDEDNTQLDALKAMAYEGEPHEVAENFRQQGNECFRERKYKDAIEFYTRALDQHCNDVSIDIACLGNRAQANLELKNYRRCVLDCASVLEIDIENSKAWYRTAKALLAVDKVDEAMSCCEQGLANDMGNASFQLLREKVAKRRSQKIRLEKAQLEKEQQREDRAHKLNQAKLSRGIENKNTIARSNVSGLELTLEDVDDPNSEMMIPMLVLYPLTLQSDIITVSEFERLDSVLDRLFTNLPSWASEEYRPTKLDLYAPTASGGLARVGVKSTLGKLLSTKNIITIDGMARAYVVPKAEAKQWLSEWDKTAQAQQFVG